MTSDNTKHRLFALEMILVLGLAIFMGAFALNKYFPTQMVSENDQNVLGIVGFVPVKINNQPIDLLAKEPTSFLLYTEREQQFQLTSFRLSGTVEGDGRVEISLDNGIGQELLIYSNLKPKKGNLITGFAVDEDVPNTLPDDVEIIDVPADDIWLNLKENPDASIAGPKMDATNMRTSDEEFEDTCKDTCYIDMNMRDGLYYTLKVSVDPGTTVRITSLKYTLEV